MAKVINYLNLRKPRLQFWKDLENLREIFWRPLEAVKPLFAITWKVQISMEQENRLAGQKNYHLSSRKELFAK